VNPVVNVAADVGPVLLAAVFGASLPLAAIRRNRLVEAACVVGVACAAVTATIPSTSGVPGAIVALFLTVVTTVCAAVTLASAIRLWRRAEQAEIERFHNEQTQRAVDLLDLGGYRAANRGQQIDAMRRDEEGSC